MRVGILGAGFMGSTHARCFAALPGITVASIFAPTGQHAAPLAAELNAAWVTRQDDILDDDTIGAVSICLPSPFHADAAVRAIERGKHVLCEKPLALTLADGQRIVDAAARTERTVMIAHVLRFWPEYVALRDLVASGDLGRPIAALASRRQAWPAWTALLGRPDLTGGIAVDLQIHDLDICNWLFGAPASVVAAGTRGPHTGDWEHSLVTVTYAAGAATVEGSLLMPDSYPFSASLRVLCEAGCVEYTFQAGGRSVEMGRAEGNGLVLYPATGKPSTIEVQQEDAYQAEVAYFVECASTGVPADRAMPADALA
ncbi:MAG: Gfo/Idh/MocA family protein, partial [Thermomicrobiales bacterium]